MEKKINKLIMIWSHTGKHKPGGGGLRAGAIYEQLTRRGYDAYLIMGENAIDNLIDRGICTDRNTIIRLRSYHWIKYEKIETIISLLTIVFILRRIRPDVIHSFQCLSFHTFFVELFSCKCSTNTVSEVNSYVSEVSESLVGRLGIWLAAALADRIDCLSYSISETIKGITNTPVYTSPCSFNPIPPQSNLMPVCKKNIDIAFSGFLNKGKGIHLFLSAIEKLYAVKPNLSIAFLGWGDAESDIVERIEDGRLPKDTIFEYSLNPSDILCKVKIFCSLQLKDNYPSQALIQAMEQECAIIATDVGDTYRIVPDHVGVRVAFSDNELYDKLLELMEDEEDLLVRQKEARKHVTDYADVYKFMKYFTRDIVSGGENICSSMKLS